jgi:hypothetical protein
MHMPQPLHHSRLTRTGASGLPAEINGLPLHLNHSVFAHPILPFQYALMQCSVNLGIDVEPKGF